MRLKAFLLPLLLVPGLVRSTAQMSQELASLPTGEITEGVYSNDALGVRVRVPEGWSLSTDLSNTPTLDSRPEGLANRCVRILMRQDAPKSNGGFPSWGIFFAIDAKCLSLGRFPKSIKERDEITRLTRLLVDNFKFSPFFPPSGVDIDASPPAAKQLSVIVILTGSGHAAGPDSEATGPHLNTLFCVTEHNGHWLGWANVGNDAAKERLKQEGKVEFSVH
jgi:hypothetical protein